MPGMPDGVVFTKISAYTSGDARGGQVSFAGTIAGPGIDTSNDTGHWAGDGDDLRLIAREGDPVPGAGPGTYLGELRGHECLGAADTRAVVVQLQGPGVNADTERALLGGTFDDLELLVREGDAVPGHSPYLFFDTFDLAALNAAGQALFTATLRGYEVSDINDESLWVTDLAGQFQLIVREGDLFDVGGGELRRIKIIGDPYVGTGANGSPTCLNDRGQVAFNLTFDDATTGVFMTTVPEPSTLVLLMVAASLLLTSPCRRWWRVRANRGAIVVALILAVDILPARASPVPGELLLTLYNPWPTSPNWSQGFGRTINGVGNTVAVGVTADDPFGISNAGSIFVYDADNGDFLRKITDRYPQPSDSFGNAVAAFGTCIFAGHPKGSSLEKGIIGSGRSLLFDARTGTELLALENPAPKYQAGFGTRVATTAHGLLVGTATSAGPVYYFDGTSGDLLHEFTSPGAAGDDSFGSAIAATGDRVLIGARQPAPATRPMPARHTFTMALPGKC